MSRHGHERGFMLLECLVYIAVLAAVLGVAFAAFHRCLKSSGDLRRNADDIVRVLHVGERWRDDVRAATAPPRLEQQALRIPQRSGEIVYRVRDGSVWREAGTGKRRLLAGIKNCRFEADQRASVNSWRWELELTSPQKAVRVRPLFTFQAVTAVPP